MKKQLLSLLLLLGLMMTLGAGKGRAQITGALEADVPFSFYAGDTKFPPGKYIIRPLNETDKTVMEISTPDSRNSALIQVRESEANSSPAQTELVFSKYGSNYVLRRFYDQGNKFGAALEESRYQKKFSSTGATAEERHVPARHKTQ